MQWRGEVVPIEGWIGWFWLSIRQRHGCSPDRGDCHSFHFFSSPLAGIEKETSIFHQGTWQNKNHANRRRFCVKNLSRTAYKAIGVTVGVNGFFWISKSGEKTRKSPEILRFRELFLAEKERFELSRRYSRPTPLAGAPLRPLEYFSKYSSEAAACMGFRTFLLYYILRRLSSLFR